MADLLESSNLLLNYIKGLIDYSKKRHCEATDKYFAKIMHKSVPTIQRYLKHLKDTEQITIVTSRFIKDPVTNVFYKKRKIFLNTVSPQSFALYRDIKRIFFNKELSPEAKKEETDKLLQLHWRGFYKKPNQNKNIKVLPFLPSTICDTIEEKIDPLPAPIVVEEDIMPNDIEDPEDAIADLMKTLKQRFEDSKFDDNSIVNQYAERKIRERDAAIATGKFTMEDFCFGPDFCDPPDPEPENETDDERADRQARESAYLRDEKEAREIEFNMRYMTPDEQKRYLQAITNLVHKLDQEKQDWANRILAREKNR